MRTHSTTRRRWWQAVALGLLGASAAATAQTFTTLKSFGILTNVTGFYPQSELVQGPDGTLYGTTYEGEGNVRGTVFKLQPDGSGFRVLKWFTNRAEGANPHAGLTLLGSVLYGTTTQGGNSNAGTVFKMSTDGAGYTVLKHCNVPDGAYPYGNLILSGNTLYGTTSGGGSSNYGTIFKMNIDGTGHTRLKNFRGVGDGWEPRAGLTLSDGILYGTTYGGYGLVFKIDTNGGGFAALAQPGSSRAGLVLSGNTLYGTTWGAIDLNGTVFKVNIDGTGYTVLKHGTFLEGRRPHGNLILSGNTVYGTMFSGGGDDWNDGGAVFQMNIDGTGYMVLKHFVGSDGGFPTAGLILSGNTLYGTTYGGGPEYFRSYDEIIAGNGPVFKVNTDGTSHTVLKYFTSGGRDALSPQAGLTLSGNVLYGTTTWGGTANYGTVFKMNVDGSGYAVLKHFTGNDGAGPSVGLKLSSGWLYSVTTSGGSSGYGTVFRMNENGTTYQVLKHFGEGEGRYPSGSLALLGNTLYGTTSEGGGSNRGIVFRMNLNGAAYMVLKNFTGNDGANPYGGLTLSGSTLYGATSFGGSSSRGAVFKVNIDGTGYTVLKHFAPNDDANPYGGLTLSGDTLYGTTSSSGGTVFKLSTNGGNYTVIKELTAAEGIVPRAGLALSGGTLYGTTTQGGSSGRGTLFRVNTDGTGYMVLKHFTGGDGSTSWADLTLSGSVLYGTTQYGGSFSSGTVFKIDLSGIGFVAEPGGSMILNWIDSDFALQAAAEVAGPFANVPGATSPYTNAVSANRKFFRLVGN